MSVLELDSVWKEYHTDGAAVVALRDVTLRVMPSEFVAFVGRSGCGKTTLLNLCGAMDFPTRGSVRIEGTDTAVLGDAALTRLRRRQVGFVFQFFQLVPTLTAVENVELPGLLAGDSSPRNRAMECLRWVDTEPLAARYPHQLSGGQCQRVAIARALVQRPRIILADEPIGNLDTAAGNAIVELLRRTARQQGTTILMATHSVESVEYCDAVVRLRDGSVERVERR